MVNAYLQSDKGKDQFEQFDMQPVGGKPEELNAFIADEIAKWGPVVKALNISL